jgi:hypothetical protein
VVPPGFLALAKNSGAGTKPSSGLFPVNVVSEKKPIFAENNAYCNEYFNRTEKERFGVHLELDDGHRQVFADGGHCFVVLSGYG